MIFNHIKRWIENPENVSDECKIIGWGDFKVSDHYIIFKDPIDMLKFRLYISDDKYLKG